MPKLLHILCNCFVIFICSSVYCQVNRDSSLIISNAFGELWKVKPNKGLFGLSKPDFGPFTTINVSKSDAAVRKKKIKEAPDLSVESGSGMDIRRNQITEKSVEYLLQLLKGSDTVTASFIIHTVTKEYKKTFLGKMLSKNNSDDDNNENESDQLLSFTRDLNGTISSGIDTIRWNFAINDYRNASANFIAAGFSSGYLRNNFDSLFFVPANESGIDYILQNSKGEHLAAIALQQMHGSMYVKISAEVNPQYQYAIAALFAVLVSIKDI